MGWPQGDLACPAPSLQPDYRAFITTTGRSAPVSRIGTLPLTAITAGGPSCCDRPEHAPARSSVSRRQVLLFHASAHGELTPPIHRTPPGQRAASPLAAAGPQACRSSRKYPQPPVSASSHYVSTRQQWFTHVRLLAAYL